MDDGFEFGKWVELQKRYYTQGILQEKRIRSLEMLKIAWKRRSYWDVMYDEAEKYYNTHGSLRMKRNYTTESGMPLGVWIGTQKTHKDKLSEEQVRRLDKVGMDWMSIPDRKWEEAYRDICTYYEENGDINKIPSLVCSKNGISLSSWIRTQRSKYRKGKLSSDRIERLEKINMKW